MVNSAARAFGSPFRYVQGPGEFNHLPEYLKPYRKACVIINSFLYTKLSQKLENTYGENEGKLFSIRFKGEYYDDEVQEICEIVRNNGVALIVDIGEGKALDIARLCADSADLPVIIVPTFALTGAPVGEIAMLCTADGEYIGLRKMKHNAHLALANGETIAKAPKHLFVVGMGDTLTTYPEALACQDSDPPNYIAGSRRRYRAGVAVAESSWDILSSDGRSTLMTLERGVITESLENVIEASTLLSGLGFLNTGLATAHDIHSGLAITPSACKHPHGGKVAFGIVCQMVVEDIPAETVDKVMHFMMDIGLPVTLEQLNAELTEENITAVAKKTTDGPLVHQEPVFIIKKTTYDATSMVDKLGKKCRDT